MSVHVTIGGTEYAQVIGESVVVSEAIGRPPTARFTVEDMDSSLAAAGWVPARLADVRLYDDAENLFRGQITLARGYVEGVRRVLEVEAEGYDRLLDYGLVGTNIAQYTHFIEYVADGHHWPDVTRDEGDPYWVDPGANTGIAYPAQDDKSVVQALFSRYWSGPALTWDITTYGNVDQGTSGSAEVTEGRTWFDQTSLRDALERTASLVGGRLFFWIDADLVFHWRMLTGHTWSGAVSVPTGSTLHTLPRLFPEFRVVSPSPYGLIAGDANSLPAKLGVEVAYGPAVDSVYVRAGTAEASGWETVATDAVTTGAKAFVSAPWVSTAAERPTAVAYAEAEWGERRTYTVEAAGPWTGIHVGQSMTIYSPTLGVINATTQPIMANDMRFLPDGNRAYYLQLGDGPIRTMTAYTKPSAKQSTMVEGKLPDPINMRAAIWSVNLPDVSLPKGGKQQVYAQYTDAAGKPLPMLGIRLRWGLTIWENGNTVGYNVDPASATDSGRPYRLGAAESVTAQDGRAANMLFRSSTSSDADACQVWVELV